MYEKDWADKQRCSLIGRLNQLRGSPANSYVTGPSVRLAEIDLDCVDSSDSEE